ncbi:MAG: ATP-binding protein [Paracoccaceae bacterium]
MSNQRDIETHDARPVLRSETAGWTFDISRVKRLDKPDNVEIKMRALFLGVSCLLLYFTYDMVEMLVWYAVRMGWLAGYFVLLRHLPDRISVLQTIVLTSVIVADGFLYVGLSIYFWQLELPVFMAYAMAIITTSMITAMWIRAEEPYLWICDTFAIATCTMTLPIVHYLSGKPLTHVLLLAGTFALVLIYFVFSLWTIWKGRAEFRTAQHIEMERTKVEAMGRLTGGVAHDFNNLLTVILGNIELSRLVEDDNDRDELLDEAHAAGERAARLTAQLLSFSRQSVLSPREVDVSDVIDSAQRFLMRLLPASVRITRTGDLQGLPMVRLDTSKLEAVVINLAINARDAMPDGGVLKIGAVARQVRPSARMEVLGLNPGRYVVLIVEDEGEGIAKELMDRVTDPFFTTKPVGEGSGLGLSMAKGFAEQSGGALTIDSEIGEGTRVQMYLPVVSTDQEEDLD